MAPIQNTLVRENNEREDPSSNGYENRNVTTIINDDSKHTASYDVVDLSLMRGSPLHDLAESAMEPNSSFSTTMSSSSSHRKRFNNSIEFCRSFKDRMRNSIRRGKNYLKNELTKGNDGRQWFNPSTSPTASALFPSDELEKYKANYSEKMAEKLYQLYSSQLSGQIELTDQHLIDLINQITYQKAIRNQLSNAVSICRNSREFESSSELVEAERLLLLSSLKEVAAKHELIRIDNSHGRRILSPSIRRGAITINRIDCRLKEIIVKDTVFNYFYVCMCSYREQILSTHVVESTGDRLCFIGGTIVFTDLEPDYEINVEIFALRLRKNVRTYSHESKFHLNKV